MMSEKIIKFNYDEEKLSFFYEYCSNGFNKVLQINGD